MIKILSYSLLILVFTKGSCAYAQDEIPFLKNQVEVLCGEKMAGRGYVNNGKENAARYLQKKFKEFGLKPVGEGDSFVQSYYFPVNTFPGEVSLKLGRKKMKPGIDFLVDAGSTSFKGKRKKVVQVDLNNIKDSKEWANVKARWNLKSSVYLLQNADTLCKRLSEHIWGLVRELPKGCYIIPQHGKLTWTTLDTQFTRTVLYIEDTVIPRKIKHAGINIEADFITNDKNENVIGMVPGAVKDSFIVFSAHYDHLGMMGRDAMFPGASDNASGTAMLLYLAQYFSTHPQHYSIVFISFSGEEAGLKGSEYFVKHPLIPLDHIHFLTNLDIMGDASDGVTVVNATEYPRQFEMLQKINLNHSYLPAVKSRGKAANSDHYHFTEAGVPSFFIYSNGGKGYYHDVFDKASSLSFNNIDKLAKLLIEFGEGLNK